VRGALSIRKVLPIIGDDSRLIGCGVGASYFSCLEEYPVLV